MSKLPDPLVPPESGNEVETDDLLTMEDWFKSCPSDRNNNPMNNGRPYTIVTAWHHDASLTKNLQDMQRMEEELKGYGLYYSHIWRSDAGREFPAFAVNTGGIATPPAP